MPEQAPGRALLELVGRPAQCKLAVAPLELPVARAPRPVLAARRVVRVALQVVRRAVAQAARVAQVAVLDSASSGNARMRRRCPTPWKWKP